MQNVKKRTKIRPLPMAELSGTRRAAKGIFNIITGLVHNFLCVLSPDNPSHRNGSLIWAALDLIYGNLHQYNWPHSVKCWCWHITHIWKILAWPHIFFKRFGPINLVYLRHFFIYCSACTKPRKWVSCIYVFRVSI